MFLAIRLSGFSHHHINVNGNWEYIFICFLVRDRESERKIDDSGKISMLCEFCDD
jgi:hypothetical protein